MFWTRSKASAFAALAMLAVAPAAAAQTLTPPVATPSAFGAGDCRADTPINVSYTSAAPTQSANTIKVQLFATKESCPGQESNASSIAVPSDGIVLVSPQVQNSIGTQTATLHVTDLADPGGGCDVAQSATWNLCFYELYQPISTFGGTTDWVALQSTSTLTYDSLPPNAPQIASIQPGDQQLHIDIDAPSDTDITGYTVLIAPAATVQFGTAASSASTGSSGASTAASSASGSTASSGSGSSGSSGSAGSDSGSTGASGSSSSSSTAASSSSGGSTGGGSACMSGPDVISVPVSSAATSLTAPGADQPLQNGVQYAVQVQASDSAGNTGPCSVVALGTPQRIDDFWRLYTGAGGGDPGGCSQTDGITLLALLGAGLLVLRGRKKGSA